MIKLPLLSLTLAALLLSTCFRSEQKLASEEGDAKVQSAQAADPLTLNNDPVGTAADLTPFRTKIKEIMSEREKNGFYAEGTNEVSNYVLILATDNSRVGGINNLVKAINESGGRSVFLTTPQPTNPVSLKPNPLTLVVKIAGPPTPDGFIFPEQANDAKNGYANLPMFETIGDRGTLKKWRLNATLEVSSDDKFFVNASADVSKAKNLDDAQVQQRAVDAASLEKEIDAMLGGGSKKLTFIASESASYASLIRVLRIAAARSAAITVLVRPRELKT